uniref:ubiquitinyl hydrolase 1 n=1 Tax=Neogobius melanostomus TaxID=47308 RepID=A0A8C6WW22_9GOBI
MLQYEILKTSLVSLIVTNPACHRVLMNPLYNMCDVLGKDELQAAIELSLQESHKAQEEEKEFHRALEASAEESAARLKRRRCEGQGDMCSPADWIRQDEWPVGIRNVGNTCWFSAVIQSLFHLPVFKRLVLNYHLNQSNVALEQLCFVCFQDKRNIAFMQELRCLFALMVGSTRRFVDPSASVELLRDAFRTSEAQQVPTKSQTDIKTLMREALTYLAHAYDTNCTLLKNGRKRGVDDSLIAVYRRKCLTTLNESASRLFCSGDEDKVKEALAIMDESVIPCLHLMSRDSALSQEERDALESIRSQWCCCLSHDMDESLQVKLGEFLPRVLDSSAERVVLKDPPDIHIHVSHDLCSRLAALMESIHSTSVVSVQ